MNEFIAHRMLAVNSNDYVTPITRYECLPQPGNVSHAREVFELAEKINDGQEQKVSKSVVYCTVM